ncbi:hypothetical protein BGZ68_009362 [Mortierella alpina]|nr:hypothetical protein BGZ68_009362 [Mortierella alpina]
MQSDSVHGFIDDDSFKEINVTFTIAYCKSCWSFEAALRTHYSVVVDDEVDMGHYYRFCEVHFKRSLTRVRLEPLQEMAFYNPVLDMLSPSHSRESLMELVDNIKAEYPKASKWLSWHLHESKGKHIFPALNPHDLLRLSKDTNAQESTGGDFRKNLSLMETLDHAYRYSHAIKLDYGLASEGLQLRYGDRKRKFRTIISNDARSFCRPSFFPVTIN